MARAFGGAVIRDRHRPGPAAYDSRGERYVFVPAAGCDPARYAIDVERRGEPAPEPLRRALGSCDDEAFFRRWTEAEVVCKLSGMPVLQWLALHRDGRFDEPALGIELERRDSRDLWLAAGYRGPRALANGA